MARLYRMLSPGSVFALLGLGVFAYGEWPSFQWRGGLTVFGLYVLAFQVLLSSLLISAIDDLPGRGRWRRGGRRAGDLIKISTRPIGFWRALAEFYRRPFWPAFLLGFGVAATLSAFATGIFQEEGPSRADYIYAFGRLAMHRSEATLGGVLLLGAAGLWFWGSASYFGWIIGVCLATVAGQVLFVYLTDVYTTVLSWGGLMIGLCLLRLLVLAAGRIWRRRFTT